MCVMPSAIVPTTRLTQMEDIAELQALEVAAGQVFCEWGMAEVAAYPPPTVAEFGRYVESNQSWVVTEPVVNRIAGFVLVALVDGCAHIEQLSVHPDFSGRRLGAGLIDWVADWATGQALAALTLTTFAEVPWNAPYYQRCGFRRLQATQMTPGLIEIRAREAELGLDAWPRVCMRREFSSRSDEAG